MPLKPMLGHGGGACTATARSRSGTAARAPSAARPPAMASVRMMLRFSAMPQYLAALLVEAGGLELIAEAGLVPARPTRGWP